jgi:hypothetical protein
MIYGDKGYSVPDMLAVAQAGNLYAYCVQNPLIYIDFTGGKIDLSFLAYPGEIHRAVQIHITDNNTSITKERWLKYPNPAYDPSQLLSPVNLRGRVDLLDTNTGYIWEIKPYDWPKIEAMAQLANYEKGTFSNPLLREKPVIYTGVPELDGYNLEDTFMYTNKKAKFEVAYWYDGDGVISYSFTQEKLQQQPQTQPSLEADPLADSALTLAILLKLLEGAVKVFDRALGRATGMFMIMPQGWEDGLYMMNPADCII